MHEYGTESSVADGIFRFERNHLGKPSERDLRRHTLCEALLLVRSCSRKHSTKADGDQVLFAYGMASVASGFTGSLISGPSASRTAAFRKETGQAPPETTA